MDADLQKLADLYIWPASSGLPRDKQADTRRCVDQLYQKNPEEKTTPSLIGVRLHILCMEGLGWKNKND